MGNKARWPVDCRTVSLWPEVSDVQLGVIRTASGNQEATLRICGMGRAQRPGVVNDLRTRSQELISLLGELLAL